MANIGSTFNNSSPLGNDNNIIDNFTLISVVGVQFMALEGTAISISTYGNTDMTNPDFKTSNNSIVIGVNQMF